MIIINCYECDKKYYLEDSKDKDIREQIIRYAKCPTCGVPRDPYQFKGKMEIEDLLIKHIEGQCDTCGEPVGNKKWNLCHRHYIAVWKKATGYNHIYMREYRKRIKITTENEGVI